MSSCSRREAGTRFSTRKVGASCLQPQLSADRPVPGYLLIHSAFPFCQLVEISGRSNRTATCFFQGKPAEIRSCCTWRSPAGRTGGRSAAGSSSGPGCRISSCPGSVSGWPHRACSPSPLRHRQRVFAVRAKEQTGCRGQGNHQTATLNSFSEIFLCYISRTD